MQEKAITIYDLAKECGVSPATVSKALNDYKGVSAKTRELVNETAMRLNFQANSMARYLNTKRSYSLGVLIYLGNSMPALKQTFFMDILESFKTQFEQNRYDIIILSKQLKGTHGSFLNHCKKRKTDGVLVFGDYTNPSITELIESDMPTVGFDYAGGKIPGVFSNNYEVTGELVRYLLSLGHRRIAFVHGELNFITEERMRAFSEAMREAGADPEPLMFEGKYYNVDFAREVTEKLLSSRERPTAILYPDDFTAIAAMQTAQKMGFSIPEDLSVAGFDGIDFADLVYPSLTTVKQNSVEIGRALARCLLNRINNGPSTMSSVVIKAKLKIGGSTAKPKAENK